MSKNVIEGARFFVPCLTTLILLGAKFLLYRKVSFLTISKKVMLVTDVPNLRGLYQKFQNFTLFMLA